MLKLSIRNISGLSSRNGLYVKPGLKSEGINKSFIYAIWIIRNKITNLVEGSLVLLCGVM